MLAVLIFFIVVGMLCAELQQILEAKYCMTDCCDPSDPSAYETNGKCWDCRGTGHTHEITETGKVQ